MKSFREAKWFDIALWAFGFVLTAMIVVGVLYCDGGPREDSPAPEKFPAVDSSFANIEEDTVLPADWEGSPTDSTAQQDSLANPKKGATS